MSNRLDPLIQRKLRAFARRRRRLIVVRGIFAALAMLLLTMLVVAAIDFFFVLPDWGRWALSGTAYIAVLIIAWRQCLSWLLHGPNERQLARLIEHAEPRLREDLLSAVELGRTQGEILDSEQFRALVQEDVAHRMERVEVKNLLPVALIRRFFGYAFCVAVVVVAMGLATGWQFSTLFLRALMPGANLDRVSRTKVFIEAPKNGDKMVAHGDTERVEIELGGERASKAFIELFSEKEGWQVLEMKPEGKDRFSATVNIGRESLHYRIKAGDALTRKYFLDARERPYVTQFEKSYEYPKYARLENRVVTEPQGDLIALEGTQVDLKLATNQRIASGELAVELGKNSQTIPLTIGPDGRLSARIPLNASGSYRVKLVSAETSFANKILPENELRAEPDQKPSVELVTPKTDLILANNELVDLTGQAADDYGLAKIVQRVRVNDGPWHDTLLNADPPQKATFEHRWDLYPLSLKAGDLVTSKIVAIDRKGYEGESRVLQITITAAGFEMRKLQALESLRAFNTATEALFDQAKALSDTARTSRDSFLGSDQAEIRRTTLVAMASGLAAWQTKYDECWNALGTALRDAPAGHTSAELVILGREISRMHITTVGAMQASLALLQANPTVGGARELMQEIAGGGQQIFNRMTNVKNAADSFTACEEAAVLVENSQVVTREQQRLMELADLSGDNAQKWQPLIARFRVALIQVKALESLLAPIADRNGTLKGRAQQVIASFSKRRERLENALTGAIPSTRLLRDPIRDLNETLKGNARQFVDWHRETTPGAANAIANIIREAGLSYNHIAKLQQDLSALRSNKQLPPDLLTSLQASRWQARGDAFKAHGDLEELRATADNPFVGDLRMATSALQALHAVLAGTEPAKIDEKLTTLDGALRVLEAGHNLQETLDGLVFLSGNERWDLRNLTARTQPPRDWRWLENRLRAIPTELRIARDLADRQAAKDREAPLVEYKSADYNPKKPGDYLVTLRLGTGKNAKTQTVPVGEPIPGTTYKLAKFERLATQMPDGVVMETSEITISEERAGRTFKLQLGRKSSDKPGGEQVLASFDGAREILEKAQQLPAWRALEGEMSQRSSPDRIPASAKADADVLAGQVKLALDLFRPLMDSARKDLEVIAPKLSELAAALAKEQAELKKETAAEAEKIDHAKPDDAKSPEDLRESQQRLAAQQAINEKVETLKDLLRAEANQQDILKADEREAMRDADDALALLKDPPPKAEEALQDAAKDAPAQQKADLERATDQQQKLADALKQIAEHFEAAEQGKPLADTRAQLREAEKALGVKDQLDQELAHAQMIAELAQKDAATLLKELEAKLPENPLMQKELSEIAKDALAAAEQKLQEATQREKSIAQSLDNQSKQDAAKMEEAQFQAQKQARQDAAKTAAQAAKQAVQAAKAAQKAAENAEQKAQQAQNQNANQKADAAGHQAEEAVKEAEKAAQAAEQMAQAPTAQEAQQKADRVMQKAEKAAQLAQQAQQSAKEAQAAAEQAAQQGGDKQADNQQAAQQAGEAAQQAEQAAKAAQEAKGLAQKAAEQAKAMAQNPPKAPEGLSPQAVAQKSAQSAAQAAHKAAEAAQQAQHSAEAAEAQAQGAKNAQAEQQADQAGKQAAKAAQAAEAAAQNAEQMAQAGTPQQAANAAQQAAQKAGEAAQAAEQAANAAQQAQNSAQQAGQNPGEQQAQNQAAAQKSGEANQQAKAAAQAARQAQAAAQAAAQQAQTMAQANQQLASAARQQPAIAQHAEQAGADISRAARHEMRLGNQAQALEALGQEVRETGQSDVPAAAAALTQAQMAAQAQGPVNNAAQELAQELAQLQKTQPGNPNSPNAQPANANAQAANAQPAGTPPGSPPAGQPAAGSPAEGQPAAGQPAPGQPAPGQPAAGQPAGSPPAGQPGAAPASPAPPATPAEQEAFARALDALDQQLHAPADAAAGQPPGEQGAQAGQPAQPGQPGAQPGQPGTQPGQPGQPGQSPGEGEGSSAAAKAMAAAAQAAQASMRQARAPQGKSDSGQGHSEVAQGQNAKSESGAAAQAGQLDGNVQASARALKPGEWGKLPKKLADQLTKGQQEAVAGDYRQAVETYYRVIAEKAKQQK